jgi:hypothetical protein
MTSVIVSSNILPAVASNKYARNGLPVSTQAQGALASAFNQVMRWRTRELFALGGRLQSIMASGGVGGVEVARAYGWVGANSNGDARYSILMAKPSSSAVADPYVQIDLYDAGGSLLNSAKAHWGSPSGTPNDTLDEFQEHTGTISGGVNAGTACSIVVTAYNNARWIGTTVWEVSTDPDTGNGYVNGPANMQPILDVDRTNISFLVSELIDNNGGTQVDIPDVLFATASATQKNIFDQTSTTVTANTPGITLDMRYKGRRAKTDVPLVVAVYGACSAGSNGLFKVYNSAGSVLLTIGPFSTTPAWLTGTVRVPQTLAKYDLMLSTAASITTINYVSIFEKGT